MKPNHLPARPRRPLRWPVIVALSWPLSTLAATRAWTADEHGVSTINRACATDMHPGIRLVVPMFGRAFDFVPDDVISGRLPHRIDSYSIMPGFELDLPHRSNWMLTPWMRAVLNRTRRYGKNSAPGGLPTDPQRSEESQCSAIFPDFSSRRNTSNQVIS